MPIKTLVHARPDCGSSYAVAFKRLGHHVTIGTPTNILDYDLIHFIGGTDITPSLYGEENKGSIYHAESTHDDRMDLDTLQEAAALSIPMVGICRGAQLLCVGLGGKLVQHVPNHNNHDIFTVFGEEIFTHGGHHQQVDLSTLKDEEYELLAWSQDVSESGAKDPDVVYYPTINALGFQYHPEWMAMNTGGWEFFQQRVEDLLNGNVYTSL